MFAKNSVFVYSRVAGLALALLAVPAAFVAAGTKTPAAVPAKAACCAHENAVKVAKADPHGKHAAKDKASCCAKKAACCVEKKACCKTEAQPCCVKKAACCAEKKACCKTKVQACCATKKADCCKPGAKCCDKGHASHSAVKTADAGAETCCGEHEKAPVKVGATGAMDCCKVVKK